MEHEQRHRQENGSVWRVMTKSFVKFAALEEWIVSKLAVSTWLKARREMFLEWRCLWGIVWLGLWACVWFTGARSMAWVVAWGSICSLLDLLYLCCGFLFLLFLLSWMEEPWDVLWFLLSLHSPNISPFSLLTLLTSPPRSESE